MEWMWSRALDVRLSEWCCSVSMPLWCGFKSRRGKNKNLTALKSNSNTIWFNFQTYIYIYIFVCAASSCLDDPLLIKFSGW